MAAGFPSPTKIWHNTSYSDISPSNPSIAPNIKGKSVVISGGGHGIGSTTAEAFAAAGAAQIHLLGRQEAKLKSTQESITSRHPSSKVHTHICDVTNHGDTARTAASAGPWDILVLNAGYLETPAKLVDSEPNEWWRAFTVNVQGLYNLTQAFLPKRNEGAVVVNTNAALCHMPPAFCATYSAYVGSKMAAAKIVEVLAAENEDVHFVNMHPGVIETPMSAKMGIVDSGKVPFDDGECIPTFVQLIN